MLKALKIIGVSLLSLSVVAYVAIKLFWPSAWVVNAPILQMLTGYGTVSVTDQKLNERIILPPGFVINTYAEKLGQARALLLLPNGDILVSSPRERKVYRLINDNNNDGRADGVETLIDHLYYPFGLAYHDGNLYIGETDAIIRVPYDVAQGTVDQTKLKRIVTGLPGGGNHYTRTLKIGPDKKLYVTIGSSCNVCIENDPRRAAMVRYDLDGTNEEIFATGLRNTVGFAWNPQDGAIYGVENGRDFLGDDFPPEEVNKITQGGFYGWPFLNGNNVKDPDLGDHPDPRIAKAIKPVHGSIAHAAPLGMTFLSAANTPAQYKNAALVTHHGSWNRTKKSGYQVVSLHWQADGGIVEKPFLTGLLKNEAVFGRPVDVVQAPDGTIFISDDFTGSVYRVSYQ